MLRKCSVESDFLHCLNDILKPSLSLPNVEVKIIDAAGFVNINKLKTWETFGQYCSEEIPWKVQQRLGDLKRFYFVFYIYKTDCMKWQTKDGRGNGARISVRKETPIAKMFQAFLKNSDRAVQDATYQHNRNSMAIHLEEVSQTT